MRAISPVDPTCHPGPGPDAAPARRPAAVAAVVDAVVVGVVAAIVGALHGFDGRLIPDVGVFTYGGERFSHGVLPYLGVFNTVGPLADAVPGAAIALGRHLGVAPISAERHAFWLLSVACCVLVAAFGRQVSGRRSVGLLAAAILMTFDDFTHLATDGPREKTVMVLFLLAALLLMGQIGRAHV